MILGYFNEKFSYLRDKNVNEWDGEIIAIVALLKAALESIRFPV